MAWAIRANRFARIDSQLCPLLLKHVRPIRTNHPHFRFARVTPLSLGCPFCNFSFFSDLGRGGDLAFFSILRDFRSGDVLYTVRGRLDTNITGKGMKERVTEPSGPY